MLGLIRPTVVVELDPSHSAVKDAAVRVEGVEFLTGTYTVISRMFHSQRVFKKSKAEGSATEAPLFLYYWRGGDGTPAGWWFGNAIGSNNAYAFCKGWGYPPPKDGWVVPVQGVPALPGLRVSTTAPRFGKFQQTFASNRNSEGAKGAKDAKGAKGAKGAGRGNKVRQDATVKAKTKTSQSETQEDYSQKSAGAARKEKWMEGILKRFKKALIGRWSGVRAGYTQYHQISEVTEGSKKGIWCKTYVEGSDPRWTQISIDHKTAYWGKGTWRIDLDDIQKNPSKLSWRSEHNGVKWTWSWEGN